MPEPPEQDAAKWRINSWSLRTKVAIVLVVPAVVALALGGLRLEEQLDEANRLSTVRDQLDVVDEALVLADLVALEMVAAVPPDPDTLPARENAVDRQISVVNTAADFAPLPSGVDRKLTEALDELEDAREQAAATGGGATDPVTEAFTYREVIADLAELVPRVVSFTRSEDLDDRAAIVLSMMLLRAALASEEALIASGKGEAVSADVAASVQHSAAEEAVLGQQLSLGLPAADLPELVSATHSWPERRDAIEEAIANNRTADLRALLPDLQAEQTDLRGLVDTKLTELADTVSVRTNQARSDALRHAALVLGALLAALAVALTVARSLLLPVRRLRAAALTIAHDKLPGTVASIRAGEQVDWRSVEPTPVPTDEEIGQLARAFDDMHQQAVRLAGEQAELRNQVSEMFMTLSRRSQSLVELQLAVIESLEADERDPRRLEGLFRLDHLATRLRRNGENLQVLAGGAPTKRGSRPVSVVAVLRAATSEVKDYQRISLGHAPNASVHANAAADVVHILAELLENAIRFSPPDRKIVLTADRGADGGLLFEVIDAGLGMADDDLESANHRLAAADAIGPETTRRMGLFVVSLLAARHEVTVRLRRSYERAKQTGITASVHVPGPLVRSDSVPEVMPAQPPVPHIPIPEGGGSDVGWFTPTVAVQEPATAGTTPGWLPPTAKTDAAMTDAVTNGTATNVTATNGTTEATKSVPDNRRPTDQPTIRTTAAGLPIRKPGGRSVPAKPATPAAPNARPGTGFRDPEAVRNNLSRHYRGVRAARQAGAKPAEKKRADEESTSDQNQ